MVDPASLRRAVMAVEDPEFPGVPIGELGMVDDVVTEGGTVRVELVPTYAGCPALDYIAADVTAAVHRVDPSADVQVAWHPERPWSPQRVTADAARVLAGEFTVVLRGPDGSLRCPVCGTAGLVERSPVGPTRCRAVSWCPSCRNVVEVLR